MLRKLLFGTSLIMLIPFFSIFAQEEDSVSTHKSWNWNWDWNDEWGDWRKGKPSIEFSYGFGNLLHENFVSDFAKAGSIELKLGYFSEELVDDNIINEFKERYVFASRISSSLLSEKPGLNELRSNILRFGFGRRSGYGYDFNNIKILPYVQHAAVWTKLEMKDFPRVGVVPSLTPVQVASDNQIVDRYDGAFRFGTLNEGGLRFELGKLISFNAGYEASVIFPRHMFWKHLTSYAIESIGLHSIDHFVDEVLDSSPAAAPVVNFVLKNGYNYLFYTLKKKKMNWPFNTETPLTIETVKFGVTFTF